jgi:hypothetical protein
MPTLEDEVRDQQPQEPVSIDEQATLITEVFGEAFHDYGGDLHTGPDIEYRYSDKSLYIQAGLRGSSKQKITIRYYEEIKKRFLFFSYKTGELNEYLVFEHLNIYQDGEVIERITSIFELKEKLLPLVKKVYQRALEVVRTTSLEDNVTHHPSDPGL